MGILNLTPRNYSLYINGVNCSTALVQLDGGYSHYEQSGLITISGKIVLQRALDFTHDMNDKTNATWAMGKKVDLYIADNAGGLVKAPILGTTYILNSTYDGINKLEIEIGCVIALLNYRTPIGQGVCLEMGEQTSLTIIASQLLEKAGVTAHSVSLAGNLSVRFPKLTNESYLQTFGRLCWHNSLVAYQDNYGVLKTIPVTISSSPLVKFRLGSDDNKYQRLNGVQKPVEIVKAVGIIKTVATSEESFKNSSETTGSGAIISAPGRITKEKIETTYKIDRQTRTVTSTTKTQKPMGLVFPETTMGRTSLTEDSYIEEKKYYEPKPGGAHNCSQPDEARLTKHEIITKRPYGVIFAKLIEDFLKPGGALILTGAKQTMFVSEYKVTYYTYPQPKIDPQSDLLNNQAGDSDIAITPVVGDFGVKEQTWIPKGTTYIPEAVSEVYSNHADLFMAEELFNEWNKASEYEWNTRQRKTLALMLYAPDIIQKMKESGVVISQDAYFEPTTAEDKYTYKISNTQTQPPSPDRFPVSRPVRERIIRVDERLPPLFGSQFKEKFKIINLDSNFLTSKDQAKKIAKIEGAMLWGRYKGITASTDVSRLLNVKPLDCVSWANLQGRTETYLADGLSFAMNQTQMIIGFDGIWTGYGTSSPVAFSVAVDEQPAVFPISVPVSTDYTVTLPAPSVNVTVGNSTINSSSITAQPGSVVVVTGSTGVSTVTTVPSDGSASSVSIPTGSTATLTLPSGLTVSLNQSSVSIPGGVTGSILIPSGVTVETDSFSTSPPYKEVKSSDLETGMGGSATIYPYLVENKSTEISGSDYTEGTLVKTSLPDEHLVGSGSFADCEDQNHGELNIFTVTDQLLGKGGKVECGDASIQSITSYEVEGASVIAGTARIRFNPIAGKGSNVDTGIAHLNTSGDTLRSILERAYEPNTIGSRKADDELEEMLFTKECLPDNDY